MLGYEGGSGLFASDAASKLGASNDLFAALSLPICKRSIGSLIQQHARPKGVVLANLRQLIHVHIHAQAGALIRPSQKS
jgi:hypothetical protein